MESLPHVNTVRASLTTRGGIDIERSLTFSAGVDLPRTQLSRTLGPYPGDLQWANGAFFAVYAERNKRSTLIKLRRVTCKR